MPGRWRHAGAVGLACAGLCAAAPGAPAHGQDVPRIARITFLDAEQAVAALSTDEAERYFGRLQSLEMSAKTGRVITGEGLPAQREECRERYREAVMDFSTEEKAILARAIAGIQPHLQRNYARVIEAGWSFLKLDSHIEGGLPHTVGPYIVVSPRFLEVFAGNRDRGRDEKLWHLETWLLHEQLHVTQHRHPRLFHRLYTEVWGFRRAEGIRSHPWLIEHQIIDPDVQEGTWVYPVQTESGPEWIWPSVMLGESRGVRRLLGVPSLARDVRMVAVGVVRTDEAFALRVDSAGMPMMRRLLSFEEYRAGFPFSMAPFHPDEIAAEGFARIVITDMKKAAESTKAEAGEEDSDPRTEQLRRWFAANLD